MADPPAPAPPPPTPPARFEVQVKIIAARELYDPDWRQRNLNPYATAWVDSAARLSTYVFDGGNANFHHWRKQKLCIPFSTDIEESTLYIEIRRAEAPDTLVGTTELSLGQFNSQIDTGKRTVRTLRLSRPDGLQEGWIVIDVGICDLGTTATGFTMGEVQYADDDDGYGAEGMC